MKTAYLAGPDVFFDNATEIARSQKLYCQHHNIIGLSPLDGELVDTGSKYELAKAIVEANIALIQRSDCVIANLSNFRGTKLHPSCDAGTAWECGYAAGLCKPVLAYTDISAAVPLKMRAALDYCIIGDFFDALYFADNFQISSHPRTLEAYEEPICLDSANPSIRDADAYGAFRLGFDYALGKTAAYTLSDKRSLIEKYGTIDRNGVRFEDFDMPANIMISISHRLA